jgi:hypothetical protein
MFVGRRHPAKMPRHHRRQQARHEVGDLDRRGDGVAGRVPEPSIDNHQCINLESSSIVLDSV